MKEQNNSGGILNNRGLTVKELINLLEQVEDKDKEVFVYSEYNGDLYQISDVDLTLGDRVDIQIDD